jgi:hypothetical protein
VHWPKDKVLHFTLAMIVAPVIVQAVMVSDYTLNGEQDYEHINYHLRHPRSGFRSLGVEDKVNP